MNNLGYYQDTLSNQPVYRCQRCKFDTFEVQRIQHHVRYNCRAPRALPEDDIPLSEWRQSHKDTLRGLDIGVSLLTWNTREASEFAAKALLAEAQRLHEFGVKLHLFWADNGSDDGTNDSLNDIFGSTLAAKVTYLTNMGQSRARNDLIWAFLESKAHYMLMVDGDIELVPYSAFAMARFMESVPDNIGCIGMNSRNCTHKLDLDTATNCRKIESWMTQGDPEIAWTNYGMFRKEVFTDCMFDETGPFNGPGWGFEDDDLYMQMRVAGYDSLNTPNFRHLHRRRHSSVKNLGMDNATVIHNERQRYLAEKWKNEPLVADRIRIIRHQTMPHMEY